MSTVARPIELLAPARDAATGIEAILHGADAVYIGASRFGARAAAGNTTEDIRRLVEFAHVYKAKVYVTLNTILYDDELDAARSLIGELTAIGVDALIVQDMAIRQFRPSLPLHASTQMDNRTAQKVEWLYRLGFSQVVLARELTLEEIGEIHRSVPDVRLEVFVHGAICVSYNGQCYASQHCFRRSANRGECAQFCRLPFDLIDAKGRVLERQKHLLSLRDMNRSAALEALLDAGVSSLKIEGRLKDAAYVKNVTAYYRQQLDEIFLRRSEYCRSSIGQTSVAFVPHLAKSFNRGFTDYFLHGRTPDLANPHTPKSMGEEVGTVKRIGGQYIEWEQESGRLPALSNGDGLCFLDDREGLVGFRINKVEGNRIYPSSPLPHRLLGKGTRLYRNHDHAFEQTLSKPTATRKIGVRWLLREVNEGFLLRLTREDGLLVEQLLAYPHEAAHTPQREQIERQLARLGDTPYLCKGVDIETEGERFFPGSLLAEGRRVLCKKLSDEAQDVAPKNYSDYKNYSLYNHCNFDHLPKVLPYTYNVSNWLARQFYIGQGVMQVDEALEVATPQSTDKELLLMTCRYCIRHQLGMCLKTDQQHRHGDVTAPLFLRLADGRRFRLHFDCHRCQMEVYATLTGNK